MLDNSINNAMYVAYTNANKKIEIKNQKHLVVATTLDIELEIGDELLEVEGKPIESFDMIKETIQNHEIGETITSAPASIAI